MNKSTIYEPIVLMSLSYSHAHSAGSGTTEVVAVLIAITNNKARVLTVDDGKLLPNGPLMPLHRSLQAGVRQWVEEQTEQPIGYMEQLYTFVDTNRRNSDGHALVYVSYMGLVQELLPPTQSTAQSSNQARWQDWYTYFPWENHLTEQGKGYVKHIVTKLWQWAQNADDEPQALQRRQRISLCWGWNDESVNNISNNTGDDTKAVDIKDSNKDSKNQPRCKLATKSSTLPDDYNIGWVAEHALLRYEMLYEAGLLPESPEYQPNRLPDNWSQIIGKPMYYDHRRVIATAISRLRAKIEYRPLIFGLMPDTFTLSQLQKNVEALSGVKLHKQNFRRLLEHQNLVEPTGESSNASRGRPAKLYRFRYDVELQSLLMDSKLPKRK